MKIFKQLLREFWIPFLGALIWTIINYLTADKDQKGWTDIINIAMPSFFFVSWITGQYFRVKKQTNVTESLLEIEERVGNLLTDITQQSERMQLVTDTQIYQTFDVCLDLVRETKEELADRNRQFKKDQNINLEQFEFYRENPFYQSKRYLNRLISYAIYTLRINKAEELEDRYNRTAYHSEELVGSITSFIGRMNHIGLDWKTAKTDSILKDISKNLTQLKNEIVPNSRFKNNDYKGYNLNKILESQIEKLDELSQ